MPTAASTETKPNAAAFKRNQPVRISAAAGRTETGRVVKLANMGGRPMDRDWYIVRFDVDGARLCVAVTSLQAA